MNARTNQSRDFALLGHELAVFLSDADCWSLAVDGEAIAGPFETAYAAWAVGVSECYRQGRRAPRSRGGKPVQ